MFALRDGERLYLTSWVYNSILVIQRLIDIIRDNDGKISEPRKHAIVTNRTLTGMMHDCEARMERLKALPSTPDRLAALENLERELEQLSSIPNDPIRVIGQNWIRFAIDGMMGYIELDDNPFFDFHYIKTRIDRDGTYSKDACCEVLDASWLEDTLLRFNCTEEARDQAASKIFETFVASPESTIRRNSRKVRVANTYDGRYHYETVFEKERRAKIDF